MGLKYFSPNSHCDSTQPPQHSCFPFWPWMLIILKEGLVYSGSISRRNRCSSFISGRRREKPTAHTGSASALVTFAPVNLALVEGYKWKHVCIADTRSINCRSVKRSYSKILGPCLFSDGTFSLKISSIYFSLSAPLRTLPFTNSFHTTLTNFNINTHTHAHKYTRLI